MTYPPLMYLIHKVYFLKDILNKGCYQIVTLYSFFLLFSFLCMKKGIKGCPFHNKMKNTRYIISGIFSYYFKLDFTVILQPRFPMNRVFHIPSNAKSFHFRQRKHTARPRCRRHSHHYPYKRFSGPTGRKPRNKKG